MTEEDMIVVTWSLKDKIVCFFLKEGEVVCRENITDVQVYPKAKEEQAE